VIFNPAPAIGVEDILFRDLDHLIMNESEAISLSGAPPITLEPEVDTSSLASVADTFIQKGVRNVVITLGSHGVFYHSNTTPSNDSTGTLVPADRVPVVDTTAAGDTFVGAYAVEVGRAMRSGNPFNIHTAILSANAAAAKTVQKHGAQASIPFIDEIK
jgi:ribokinase